MHSIIIDQSLKIKKYLPFLTRPRVSAIPPWLTDLMTVFSFPSTDGTPGDNSIPNAKQKPTKQIK